MSEKDVRAADVLVKLLEMDFEELYARLRLLGKDSKRAKMRNIIRTALMARLEGEMEKE